MSEGLRQFSKYLSNIPQDILNEIIVKNSFNTQGGNFIEFIVNNIKNNAYIIIIIVRSVYDISIKILLLIILPITSEVSFANQYSVLYSFCILLSLLIFAPLFPIIRFSSFLNIVWNKLNNTIVTALQLKIIKTKEVIVNIIDIFIALA